MAKKLHREFLHDLPYLLSCRSLNRILWEVFENDLGTSKELSTRNPLLVADFKKMKSHFNKALPHLLKIDTLYRKVRKISPKY